MSKFSELLKVDLSSSVRPMAIEDYQNTHLAVRLAHLEHVKQYAHWLVDDELLAEEDALQTEYKSRDIQREDVSRIYILARRARRNKDWGYVVSADNVVPEYEEFHSQFE